MRSRGLYEENHNGNLHHLTRRDPDQASTRCITWAISTYIRFCLPLIGRSANGLSMSVKPSRQAGALEGKLCRKLPLCIRG